MQRVFMFIFVFLPFFIFAQPKYEIKQLTENTTGFPTNTIKDLVVKDNGDFILAHGGNGFNPGGVTFFDGTHWDFVTLNESSDNYFPFQDVDRIYYLETIEGRKLFVYGRPHTWSNNYWLAYFDEANNAWVSLGDTNTYHSAAAINDLYIANNNEIYVAGLGFYRVSPDTFVYIHPDDQPFYYADYIRAADDGTMYLISNSYFLSDDQSNYYVGISAYRPGNGFISQVRVDSIIGTFEPIFDGSNFWFIDNEKIVKFSLGYEETIYHCPYPNMHFYYVTRNQNNFWILASEVNTNNYYILKYDAANNTWDRGQIIDPIFDWNRFEKITVTDNYIFAVNGDGLFKFSKDFQFLDYWNMYNTGIPGNEITRIFIDKHQHYWFNSLNYGVSMFNGDVWNTTSPFDINNSFIVTSWDMCVDNSNSVYMAGDSIYYYENGTWNTVKPSSSFYATSIACDNSDNVWIADNYTGLCKFTNGEATYYTTSNSGVQGNDPQTVFVDKDNNLWIGYRNHGIDMYDGTTFHNYYGEPFPASMVYDFTESPNGTIWAAFITGGVAKFENGTWTAYNTNNSDIPDNDIRAIAVDNNGNLWLGEDNCSPLYVIKFDGTNWEKVYLDSTSSGSILEIAVDQNNNVFVSVANQWRVFVLNENDVVLDVNNNEVANTFALQQNYPNPFNPTTTISYTIPQYGNVKLKVYDMLGREVATLVNKPQNKGNYQVVFNASNLASGIYFYKLQFNNKMLVRKMLLLK